MGKSVIHMVSCINWPLGTVATLSRSGCKDDHKLQHLIVSHGHCLSHMMCNSSMLYANVVLKRQNGALT